MHPETRERLLDVGTVECGAIGPEAIARAREKLTTLVKAGLTAVEIEASTEVPFSDVVSILNAAIEAKVAEISFASSGDPPPPVDPRATVSSALEPIVLNVLRDGRIKRRGVEMSDDALREFLDAEAAKERDPGDPRLSSRRVILRVDRDCDYVHVQTLMKVLARAGIPRFEIAAQRPADGGR